MKRNNTSDLTTLNFGFVSLANLLMFASLYLVLPLLPLVMGRQLDIPVERAGFALLAFVGAMLAVGPFHAYLGDAYKRKGILLYSMLGMAAAALGYAFVDSFVNLLLLALAQGACFGLAATAGITVAIDITTSAQRSAGNMLYAWAGRLGMLLGAGGGILLFEAYDFRTVAYVSVAVGLLGALVASRVYVAFRAPIGMRLYSLDRFFLPRGWVPAINLVMMAFVPGILVPTMLEGNYWGLIALAILMLITAPATRMFVRLSHHCQRGTANTTGQLSQDAGFVMGLFAASQLMDSPHIYSVAVVAVIVAALFFGAATIPYFERKQIRRHQAGRGFLRFF